MLDDPRLATLGDAAVDHAFGRFTRREVDAPHIDVEGLVEAIDGEGQRGSFTADARIVEQDGDPTEFRLGAIHRQPDGLRVLDVQRDRDSAAAG